MDAANRGRHDLRYLEARPDFVVCGSAATAEQEYEQLADVDTDVILVDMALPRMSGAELVSKLLERALSTFCLLYSAHREASYAEQALAHGTRGYVLKGTPEELLQAIRAVVRGEVYVSDALRSEDT